MATSDDVRRAVLDAATKMYWRQGYLKTTIKGVAAAAGVAPDLVRRYYANREELFAAAMRMHIDPANAIAQLLVPGIDGLGERLVRVTMRMLDEPDTRNALAAMVRDGAGAAQATAPLREFLESVIIDRVAAALRVPDARMRVTLATSYLLGVAGARYVMKMEPLASATEDEVVRLVAPAVQAALTGASLKAAPTKGSTAREKEAREKDAREKGAREKEAREKGTREKGAREKGKGKG